MASNDERAKKVNYNDLVGVRMENPDGSYAGDMTYSQARAAGLVSKPGGDLPDVQGKKVYATKTGGATTDISKAYFPTSVSINKETGNVKISAPSIYLKTQSYQENVKPVLETISQNYKLNKDYKYALLNGDDDTKTSEEWLSEINDKLDDDVETALSFQKIKDDTKEATGLDLTDEQVVKMGSVAVEKKGPGGQVIKVDDDTIQSLPESIKKLAAFKNLKGWKNGEVTYKDLMESWNRENTPDDDLIQVYNTVADYFKKGEFKDADEYAEMTAFAQFIKDKHPETGFWRGAWDGISNFVWNVLGGAAKFDVGVLLIGEGVLNNINKSFGGAYDALSFAFPMYLSPGAAGRVAQIADYAGGQNFIKDYLAPELDSQMKAFQTNSMRLNEAAGTVGTTMYNITPIFMQMAVGNALAKAAAAGVTGAAASMIAKMPEAAELGAEVGMTAEQIATATVNGTNFLMRIMEANKANQVIANSVKILNASKNATAVVSTVADIGAQIVVDVAVQDAKLSRQLLEGDVSNDVKEYVLEQMAMDAGGWAVMATAGKIIKAGANTDVGKVINAAAVPKINKWAARIGEYTDKIKIAMHHGDANWNKTRADKLIGKLEAQAPEGWRRNRLENRISAAQSRQQNLTARRIERIARKKIGEFDSVTEGASSWEDLVKNANEMKKAQDLQFIAAHALADRVYKNDVAARVTRMKIDVPDLNKAIDDYVTQLSKVLKAEDAAGLKRATMAMDVGRNAKGQTRVLSQISKESNEYVNGMYRLELGRNARAEMELTGESTKGVQQEIEYYEKATADFRAEHPELAEELDKLLEIGKKFSASTQDARVYEGVLAKADLEDMRASGYFKDGYLRTQRMKEWKNYQKRGGELNINKMRDDQHLKWGFEGDAPDEFQDITFVLFDDLNQVAKQSIRKEEIGYLKQLGEKVDVTVSGEEIQIAKKVNATKKQAVKDIQHTTDKFVQEMDPTTYGNVFNYKEAKSKVATAEANTIETGASVTKANVTTPKVTRRDRIDFVENLDVENLDDLILLDQTTPFAKAIETEEDFREFLSSLDQKTANYLIRMFDDNAGYLYPEVLSKEERLAQLPVFDEKSWVEATGKPVPKWAEKYVSKNGGKKVEDLTQIDELKRSIREINNGSELKKISKAKKPHLADDADYPGWAVSERKSDSDALRMLDESDPEFSREGTRRDYYREWKGKEVAVLEMSPRDYTNIMGENNRGLHMSDSSSKNIEEYKNRFLNGDRAPLANIEFDKNGEIVGQEGRHRALAAESAGIDKMPVVVEYPAGHKPKMFEGYNDVTEDFVLRGRGPKAGVSSYYESSVKSGQPSKYTLENFQKIIANNPDALTNLKRQYVLNNKKILDNPKVTEVIANIKQQQAIFDAETLYAQNIRELEDLRDRMNMPGMAVNLNQQMDAIIDEAIETNMKSPTVLKAMGALGDDDELMVEYATLKSLTDKKNMAATKEKLRSASRDAYNKLLTANNKSVKLSKADTKKSEDSIRRLVLKNDDPIEHANDVFTARKRVNQIGKKAVSDLDEITFKAERELEDAGYTLNDFTGRKWNDGINAEVVSVEGEGKYCIETVKPMIMKDGKVVQKAEVILGDKKPTKIKPTGEVTEKLTADQIDKMSNEWADQTVMWYEERVNQRFNNVTNKLRESGNDIVDYDDLFGKVGEINKEITGAKQQEGVVKTYDDMGREEYVKLSPTVADLITTMPTPLRRGFFGELQAEFVKIFRMGTTGGLVPQSLIRQQFRDTGLAVTAGGAVRSESEVETQLTKVYGDTIAKYYQENMPDLWDTLVKKASETGEDAKALAVKGEMNRAKVYAPDQMQSEMYRMRKKERMARNPDGTYDTSVFDTMKYKLENFANKTEKLNNMRETSLRVRVYNNAYLEALNNGHSVPMARKYAEMIQAEATTNFSRQAYHLANLTKTVPYLGSAINGSKSFWRLMAMDPVGLTTRMVGGYLVPMIALTNMSLQDPENREVYKSIPEYEKEDNIVFVLNGQKISIPVPQEVSSLLRPIQSWIETMYNANDHSIEELQANNIAGFFPYELQGFVNVDSDRILVEDDFEGVLQNHLLPGFSKLSSQMMGPLVKSGVMWATGYDPYTGKKINTAYTTVDPLTGESVIIDYKAGELAKAIGNIFQGNFNMSADMAQAVLNNLLGTGNMNIIDGLSEIAASVPTDEGIGSGLTKAAQRFADAAANPLTIATYGEASNKAWNRAVSQLYQMKEAILNDPEYNADLKALSQDDLTEEAQNKILGRIKTKKEEFQEKVLDATKNLVKNYDGGTLDRQKFAAVISLMTFSNGYSQDPTDPLAKKQNKEQYQLARAKAVETMAQMGFDSPNDGSIFGYYEKDEDTGEIAVKFYSPLAILNFDLSSKLQSDVALANIQAAVNDSGLWDAHDSVKKQVDEIYSSKKKLSKQDYANIDAIYINWNAQVAKTLAPYINRMTPEAAINNKSVKDYLYSLIEVPGEWEVNNKGRHVSLGDRGSKKKAYYDSWIKSMFGINDKYKGQY